MKQSASGLEPKSESRQHNHLQQDLSRLLHKDTSTARIRPKKYGVDDLNSLCWSFAVGFGNVASLNILSLVDGCDGSQRAG